MDPDFTGRDLDPDARRRAETLKDLIVQQRPSRWPKIIVGIAAVLALAAGGYWYHLPPDQRPPLDALITLILSWTKSLLNAPIASNPSPAGPGGTPTPAASAPADDTGLLSK